MWSLGRASPSAPRARSDSGTINSPRKASVGARPDERRATQAALEEIKLAEPRLGWQIWVATLAINLLSLALPLTILQTYDRILPHKAIGTFTLLAAGASIAVLLEMVMRIARVAVLSQLTAAFESRALAGTVGGLLAAPTSLVGQLPAGELLDKIQSIEILRGYHTGQSRLALLDLPFAALFIWLMFLIGGSIALVPVALAAALVPLTLRRTRAEEAITVRRRKGEDQRTDLLIEILRGIRTVKFLAAEPLIMRRYDRLQKTTVENSYNNLVITNDNQSLNTLFANIVLVSVVTYGALLVIDGALSVGALAACTMLAGRAVQPILRLYAVHGQRALVDTARRRLADVLALPHGGRAQSNATIEVKGEISVTELAFAYPGSASHVLRGLNLTVAAGSICGITGLDLAGKSTLARLIAGEIRPTGGQICVDGHDINGEHGSTIRAHIALVGQERTLFEGTVLDNISLFRSSGAPVENGLKAARRIGLELDIQRLPQGYSTYISDSIAEELPASFAHRIMIARALARSPKVLILDQANAGLDMRSDRLLREALQEIKGSVTILLITERPSLLRIADRVYTLASGELSVAQAGVEFDAATLQAEPGLQHG